MYAQMHLIGNNLEGEILSCMIQTKSAVPFPVRSALSCLQPVLLSGLEISGVFHTLLPNTAADRKSVV